MAPLPNIRHEMYCRYIVMGQKKNDAYRNAGFTGANPTGTIKSMEDREDVQARIQELISEKFNDDNKDDPMDPMERLSDIRSGKIKLSKEDIMAELGKNLKLAREAGQIAAANKAVELMGQEIGMFGGSKRLALADETPDKPHGESNGREAQLSANDVQQIIDTLMASKQLPVGAPKVAPEVPGQPHRPRRFARIEATDGSKSQ